MRQPTPHQSTPYEYLSFLTISGAEDVPFLTRHTHIADGAHASFYRLVVLQLHGQAEVRDSHVTCKFVIQDDRNSLQVCRQLSQSWLAFSVCSLKSLLLRKRNSGGGRVVCGVIERVEWSVRVTRLFRGRLLGPRGVVAARRWRRRPGDVCVMLCPSWRLSNYTRLVATSSSNCADFGAGLWLEVVERRTPWGARQKLAQIQRVAERQSLPQP